jgi:hypothetical protein
MPRPQFTLKTLLWLMAVVAAFCGGAAWQRVAAWQRRTTPLDYDKFVQIAVIGDPSYAGRVSSVLGRNGIEAIIEGSVVYGVSVPPGTELQAIQLLRADSAAQKYWIQFR